MFDTEDLIKQAEAVVKTYLNTEIDCLNTEKGDTLLNTINDSAWYLQNLDDKVFSYKTFIVFGINPNSKITQALETANIRKVEMFFEVCTSRDSGTNAQNVFYKMLRYTRALEQVFHKYSGKIQSGVKFKVAALEPVTFGIKESPDDEIAKPFMTAGVNVSAEYST